MVSKKIEKLRKKLKRKKRSKKADKRASARRVRKNDPETTGEKARATARQTKLLAAELGISTERARNVADEATETLENAAESDDRSLSSFDADGDGDTDLLPTLESRFEQQQQQQQSGSGNNRADGPPSVMDLGAVGSGENLEPDEDVTATDIEDDLLGDM